MTAFSLITPKDIIVANCLPVNKQTFLRHKAASVEKHEYAKHCRGGWESYYKLELGKYLSSTLTRFEKLGIRVIRELTISQWQDIFISKSAVVLLIAHWKDNISENSASIEFSDGFVTIEKMVEYIPANREMIIDLCVCHPLSLVEHIKSERQKVIVVHRNVEVLPHIWLLIYSVAFAELAKNTTDYATALEIAIKKIIGEEK